MSLSSGDQAAIIGVGVALLVALGAALFRVASFRGDINARWNRRVDFAVTALDEKAFHELEQLRDAVDQMLPSTFSPAQAIADPASLNTRAERAVKFYRARIRMEKNLNRLIWIGPALVASLAVLWITTLGLTLYYSQIADWDLLRIISLIAAGAAGATLVVTVGAYIAWQHQLDGGEILAGTAGKADQDGS